MGNRTLTGNYSCYKREPHETHAIKAVPKGLQGLFNQGEKKGTEEGAGTFDELTDLGLHGALLHILHHGVGYPGEVAHITSPHSTFCPAKREQPLAAHPGARQHLRGTATAAPRARPAESRPAVPSTAQWLQAAPARRLPQEGPLPAQELAPTPEPRVLPLEG